MEELGLDPDASNSSDDSPRVTHRRSFANSTDSQVTQYSTGDYDDLVPSTHSAGLFSDFHTV